MTTIPKPFQTPRLTLLPASLEHLKAELQGRAKFQEMLGIEVTDSWPPGEYDRDAIEYFLSRYEELGAAAYGWFGWYVIEAGKENGVRRLVAAAGFFGPPQDGVAEIGYSVIPEARNLGYATEVVSGLKKIAMQSDRISKLVAHTLKDNAASISVLAKSGFQQTTSAKEQLRFTLAISGLDEQ